MMVDGEKLDCSYPKVCEVFEDCRRSKSTIGSLLVIPDIRMPGCEAFHVDFVNNGIAPGNIKKTVTLPIEIWIDDY